ncbi:Mitochondrial copper homeostasis protein [Dimargaris cristalligena]|nr:Mitochondrial copper homeostasis protein [Dimargaris cristalligena]
MSERPTFSQFDTKAPGMYMNPCEMESKQSLECLERHQDNKKACQSFFDQYKECKKEWTRARRGWRQKKLDEKSS